MKIRIKEKRLYDFLCDIYNEIVENYNNNESENDYTSSLPLWRLIDNKQMFSNYDLFICEHPDICKHLILRFERLRGCHIKFLIKEFSNILESIKPIEQDSIEQRFERLIDNMNRLSAELTELNKQIKEIQIVFKKKELKLKF